ncbi:FAD-dependent oxidoreductase [Egibacter rhizosphaerae]|uniref:FAD-dependent oxidoreductase n=1 Tax=Egibacter rhizosphaerae TaxID=1670831 RepID=A0A411YFM6_9ACTN|nr:FAD-dependent monooxygenase [Egibacter rhizosphaerae]QBI20064.1 FAD-dependent oxidoreductase [Egibacter rhizosphaerae]
MSEEAARQRPGAAGPQAPDTGAGHALVIGAGMAGLAIAKALAERFGRVTVLDRDRIPPDVAHRKGVPQDRHLHLLLPSGAAALESLFPALGDELVDDGAATGETDRIRMCLNGHRLAPARTGHRALFASRPFVEAHVRRRVREVPTVTLREGCRVVDLALDDASARVVGVHIGTPGGDDPELLRAELVVDCSGRRSPVPDWLAAHGYAEPEVGELPIELRYVTRRFRLPEGALDGDQHVLVGPMADGPRGAAMTHVEDGSWILTLFTMAGERVPTDVAGFEQFARDLPIGDIGEAIREGEALDEAANYRFPANRRRYYERLDAFPAGLLVAGDAVCSFNPIYGQGMSVASIEATSLRRLLRSGDVPTPRTWFTAIAPVVDTAWDQAIGADLAVRAVEGRRGVPARAINRYLASLHAAAAHEPELAARFVRVAGLVDPPSRLLHPTTVARVLRARVLRSRLRRPGPTR